MAYEPLQISLVLFALIFVGGMIRRGRRETREDFPPLRLYGPEKKMSSLLYGSHEGHLYPDSKTSVDWEERKAG